VRRRFVAGDRITERAFCANLPGMRDLLPDSDQADAPSADLVL